MLLNSPILRRLLLVLLLFCCIGSTARAQRMVAITNVRLETASKAGTIQRGTLLVRDGKIAEIGPDVEIPISALVIDGDGRTVIPGIVEPYFVVSIPRNVSAAPVRTVVFQGRTFIIGGGAPAIATTFAKLTDGLDITQVNWDIARRSGITSLHLVTGGYAQSAIAQMAAEDVTLQTEDGQLLVAVTNSTDSLDVLRDGLKPPAKPNSEGSSGSTSARQRGPSAPTPTTGLWQAVQAGKAPVFVNTNNASAILHVGQLLKDSEKTRPAIVANGGDAYQALQAIESKETTLILSPSIDLVPDTRYRINLPKILADKEIEFALSLSLGQSDFTSLQDTPLFGVAMLIRAGLDRQQALRALTIAPAKLLGIEKEVGSLEVGKKANFVLFDSDPFSTSAGVDQVFVEGKSVYEN